MQTGPEDRPRRGASRRRGSALLRLQGHHVIHVGHRHHVLVHVVHDPERAGEHDHEDDHREDRGGERPAPLGRAVHMQEEHQMHEDLHRGEPHDQADHRDAADLHLAHHQREGNDGEQRREGEARHQRAHAAVAAVLRMCAHQISLTR
ncbi:hypothetical protein SDC9_37641 [bioreactor metagenome]|uniref:Uncharacterized protein n=1 Tax=bioreactor metagenome TaxID=1076179 RepID=A0A644VJS3_9ZZZZ